MIIRSSTSPFSTLHRTRTSQVRSRHGKNGAWYHRRGLNNPRRSVTRPHVASIRVSKARHNGTPVRPTPHLASACSLAFVLCHSPHPAHFHPSTDQPCLPADPHGRYHSRHPIGAAGPASGRLAATARAHPRLSP